MFVSLMHLETNIVHTTKLRVGAGDNIILWLGCMKIINHPFLYINNINLMVRSAQPRLWHLWAKNENISTNDKII